MTTNGETHTKRLAAPSFRSDVILHLMNGTDAKAIQRLYEISELKPLMNGVVTDALDAELQHLCSKQVNSILRSTKPKDLKNLTADAILKELKKESPLFLNILQTACYCKGAKSDHKRGITTTTNILKMVSPAAIIIKARCKQMSCWAAKNALALQFGGCSNMVSHKLQLFIGMINSSIQSCIILSSIILFIE